MRLQACVLTGFALIASWAASPDPVAAASDGPELQSVARKSVRRATRKPAAEHAAETIAPLPRPKGMTAEEAAAAFGAGGQVAAVGTPTPAAAATPEPPLLAVPKDPGAARTQLRAYYAVSVLADRCGFPVTTREGHLLDRSVAALERSLKLDGQQADALYSDVDTTLYGRGGGKLCVADGEQARTFRATLDKLTAH